MIISIYAIPGKQFKEPLPGTLKKYTQAELINAIKASVVNFYQLAPEKVFSKRRDRELTLARQIMHYLGKRYTQLSLGKIGEAFPGGKPFDHTTVRHSIILINNLMETDAEFKQNVEDIQRLIGYDGEMYDIRTLSYKQKKVE